MNHRLFIALLVLCISLGGCSAVRGIGFRALAIENSPLPPGAQRVRVANYPFYSMGDPVVYVTIRTSQNADDMLAFYRDAFRHRGWTEPEGSSKSGPPVRAGVSITGTYPFQRKRALKWGNSICAYAHEFIFLDISDRRLLKQPEELTEITIALTGNYAWDAPSAFFAHGIGKLIGGEQFLWLTMPF